MTSFPVGLFFTQFFAAVPQLWLRFVLAWIVALVDLVVVVSLLKVLIRPQVLAADAKIRAWAKKIRYEDAISGSEAPERHRRTNFFRFWTNFASAPSLSVFSLALAIWATGNTAPPRIFYLPGLCYGGSMLLSWVSKRVFKRVRPQRAPGAFGHKLADGSFPSGHSLTSFCFWVMLPVAAFAAGLSVPLTTLLLLLGILVIILTGLSRIYLGVHFPSDVLGGFGIGAGWCLVCYIALRSAL